MARKDSDNSMYYYHNDHLGGTHVVTDSNTMIVERTRYRPFGAIIEGGDSRNLFTGQEYDKNTGLNYYGARYYNAELRRFTQPDNVIPDYYNPQALNRYSYTLNNPLIYVDPDGHFVIYFGITGQIGLFPLFKQESMVGTIGFAIGVSDSNKLSFGIFESGGKGEISPSAGASFEVGYSPAQDVKEFSGKTEDIFQEAKFIVSGGFGESIPKNAEGSLDETKTIKYAYFGLKTGVPQAPTAVGQTESDTVVLTFERDDKGIVRNVHYGDLTISSRDKDKKGHSKQPTRKYSTGRTANIKK